MPGVFIGSTEIVDVGKIKVGGTDVQEIYVGATKIWPQTGVDPSIIFTWDAEADEPLPAGTFTRASVAEEFDGATNTQVGSGVLRENSANVFGGPQGFLADPATTNRMLVSNDLTDPTWTVRGTAAVLDLGTTSIGGNTTQLSGLAAVGNDVFDISSDFTNDGLIAPSFFLRRVTTSGELRVANSQDLARGDWRIDLSAIGSEWVFVEPGSLLINEIAAFQATSSGGGGVLFARQTGATTLTVDVAFVTQENFEFATTSVVTTGTIQSRVAEVLDTDVVIPSEFSALLDITLPLLIGSGNTITLLGPDATAIDIIRVDENFNFIMDDGGTPVTIGTSSSGARVKISYGRDATGRSASLGGATAVTGGAPGSGHEGNSFQLGSANSVNQSRCIHHLSTLYNEKKSNAELEALSS